MLSLLFVLITLGSPEVAGGNLQDSCKARVLRDLSLAREFSSSPEFPRLVDVMEGSGEKPFVIALTEMEGVRRTDLFHAAGEWWKADPKRMALLLDFRKVQDPEDAVLGLIEAIQNQAAGHLDPKFIRSIEKAILDEGLGFRPALKRLSEEIQKRGLRCMIQVQEGLGLLQEPKLNEIHQAILESSGIHFLLEYPVGPGHRLSSFVELEEQLPGLDTDKRVHLFEVRKFTPKAQREIDFEKAKGSDVSEPTETRSASGRITDRTPLTNAEKKKVHDALRFLPAAERDLNEVVDPVLKTLMYRNLLKVAENPTGAGRLRSANVVSGSIRIQNFSYSGTHYRLVWRMHQGKPVVVIIGPHENVYDEMDRRLRQYLR